jgi:hypothetical protein
MRIRIPFLAVAVACGVAAAPAGAASVAYTEGGNLVLASTDGAHKLPLTSDGTPDDPYFGVAQAADGTTVAARLESFDKRRPVLHKFAAADGKVAASNVMPASALLDGVVAPVGLDIDAAGKTVAFGYSACELSGCGLRRWGYWLTFADHGPANPSAPQGSASLYAPSFYGDRIVSSDGVKIMVQEAGNAPFNDGHTGWIDPGNAGARFWAAEVGAGVRQIALEYSHQDKWGIVIARGDGVLGGATQLTCFLPAAGDAKDVSYSPDGTLIAWRDAGGVKVAGAPDLAAPLGPGDTCGLSSPTVVISATGVDPNLGGADVPAMIAARAAGSGGGGGGGGPAAPASPPPSVAVLSRARLKLAGRRLAVRVRVPGAGKVAATLKRGRRVVAAGKATAKGAADVRVPLRLKVKPRAARGRKLVLTVRWTGAAGGVASATAKVSVR